MPEVHGWPIAFGRLSKGTGDRDRFVCGDVTAAYRVIVEGVPGGLGAGFSPWVVCKGKWGWSVLRFDNEKVCMNGVVHQTRTDAAAALVRYEQLRQGEMFDLARRSGSVDHCPYCDGAGRLPDRTGGGHHRCRHCRGTGVTS